MPYRRYARPNKFTLLLLIYGLALAVPCIAIAMPAPGERAIAIHNGDFSHGAYGWQIETDFYGGDLRAGQGSVTAIEGASAGRALRIVDDGTGAGGASIFSTPTRIPGEGLYTLKGRVHLVSGYGLGISIRALDAKGEIIEPINLGGIGLESRFLQWHAFSTDVYAPKGAMYLQLRIHTWGRVEGYIDDLVFTTLTARRPPVAGQYKIKPQERRRLTPADVVGPDGIVYPNWTMVGVQGGIPAVAPVVHLKDFGGLPDDEADDAAALERAIAAAAAAGGGAILLDAGTYYLDRPVMISDDGIVIRGQGRERTRVIFRYDVPAPGVGFFWPEAGSRVGPRTHIELHAAPEGLTRMRMMSEDNRVLANWQLQHGLPPQHFKLTSRGDRLIEMLGEGEHTLIGMAHYRDGTIRRTELRVVVDAAYQDSHRAPSTQAVFLFAGRGLGPAIALARDGKRGDMTLHLTDASALQPGDLLRIDAPVTTRWREQLGIVYTGGNYRLNAIHVAEVRGNTVRLVQPLRMDFPVIDGSHVRTISPLRRSGLEDIYLEQRAKLPISSILMQWTSECWVRGLHVKNSGSHPVYLTNAKWCEVRDSTFEDSMFKGGGGNAYLGGGRAWDCLFDGLTAYRFRHAPLVQWGSSGNVFRNSVFEHSDIQFHTGWTHENLVENCVVNAARGHGSYGLGVYAAGPRSSIHGPEGPRNVIYNCDITSPGTGIAMGGMNEGWIFAYNRFDIKNGYGLYAARASFDHILRDNVFILRGTTKPLALLATRDCIGVEFTGNTLYGGNGQLFTGPAKPLEARGNRALPLPDDLPSRPAPAVPSIYQWQGENARR